MGNSSNPVADPPRDPPDAMGHVTRISMGSSVYDEKCILCGATDARNDDRLNKPCLKADPPRDVPPERYVLLNPGDVICKGDSYYRDGGWFIVNEHGPVGEKIREFDWLFRRRADLAPAPAGVTDGRVQWQPRGGEKFTEAELAKLFNGMVPIQVMAVLAGEHGTDDLRWIFDRMSAALTPQDAAAERERCAQIADAKIEIGNQVIANADALKWPSIADLAAALNSVARRIAEEIRAEPTPPPHAETPTGKDT